MKDYERHAMPPTFGPWAEKLRRHGFTPVFEFWTHAPMARERRAER